MKMFCYTAKQKIKSSIDSKAYTANQKVISLLRRIYQRPSWLMRYILSYLKPSPKTFLVIFVTWPVLWRRGSMMMMMMMIMFTVTFLMLYTI